MDTYILKDVVFGTIVLGDFCTSSPLMCQREKWMPWAGTTFTPAPKLPEGHCLSFLWKLQPESESVDLQRLAFGVHTERSPWLEISESLWNRNYTP